MVFRPCPLHSQAHFLHSQTSSGCGACKGRGNFLLISLHYSDAPRHLNLLPSADFLTITFNLVYLRLRPYAFDRFSLQNIKFLASSLGESVAAGKFNFAGGSAGLFVGSVYKCKTFLKLFKIYLIFCQNAKIFADKLHHSF